MKKVINIDIKLHKNLLSTHYTSAIKKEYFCAGRQN